MYKNTHNHILYIVDIYIHINAKIHISLSKGFEAVGNKNIHMERDKTN